MKHLIKIWNLNNKINYIRQPILFRFSTFKTKFEKLQNALYQRVEQIYRSMNQFQSRLQYLQKLKYRKAVEDLHKKVTKIYKRQIQQQLNNTKITTGYAQLTINLQDINIKHMFHIYSQPLVTSISHQLFYEIQTRQYKPIDQLMVPNIYTIDQLYQIVVGLQGSIIKKSIFNADLDLAMREVLCTWSGQSLGFYEQIKIRCGYLEDQLMANVFQGYQDVLKQSQQATSLQKKQSLKSLKNIKKTQTFTQDFKFNLNSNLSAIDHIYASQVAKVITKYCFSSNKIKTYSLKSLSNDGFKILTRQSLQNHLFILGYHRTPIRQINDNIYKVYDILNNQNINKCENEQWVKKLNSMNSLLFYILVNKVENFELIKQIYKRIVKCILQYARNNQNACIYQENLDSFEKQLFYIMIKLLQSKYNLTYQSFSKQLNISQQKVELLQAQSISKVVPIFKSFSQAQFQIFLLKKQYEFSKSSLNCKSSQIDNFNKINNNPNNKKKQSYHYDSIDIDKNSKTILTKNNNNSNNNNNNINNISQDALYRIEDKNFVCLSLSKIQKTTEKPNGIGQLICQYYRSIGQQVKIINPLVINKCERRSGKQQYFRSKLKGIKEPELLRNRRFLF